MSVKQLPDDYTVRLIDLPASVGGAISETPDGHVDVYLNARHSHDGQLRAADHEFDHWRHDDLHNGLDIHQIEGRDGRPLPPLMRARDLMPVPEETVAPVAAPSTAPPSPPAAQLTPHQARVLLRAISDLDAWYYSDMP